MWRLAIITVAVLSQSVVAMPAAVGYQMPAEPGHGRPLRRSGHRDGAEQRFIVVQSPECGANVLYYFLQLNSVEVSKDQCRKEVPITGNGASLGDLQQAAGRYGLACDAIEATPHVLRHVELPVIAHLGSKDQLDQGHYTVLTHWGEDGVVGGIDGTTGQTSLYQPEAIQRDFTGHYLVRNNALGWSAVLEPWLLRLLYVEAGLGLLLGASVIRRWRSARAAR